VSEDDLLKDQRGSPAYISPDVLSGRQSPPALSAACFIDLWLLAENENRLVLFPYVTSVPAVRASSLGSSYETWSVFPSGKYGGKEQV